MSNRELRVWRLEVWTELTQVLAGKALPAMLSSRPCGGDWESTASFTYLFFQSPQPCFVPGAVLDGGGIPVCSELRCCKREGT